MANTLNLGTDGNWAVKKDSLLAYNSENNNFKPLPFSFSRASSGTVVNKAGLIETVGSGEPRIDFKDDVKGALLLEPQRTNLFNYSEDFTTWSRSGWTLTSGLLSPNGGLDAYSVLRTTGSTFAQSVTLLSNTTYTFSAYIKNVNATNIQLRVQNQAGNTSGTESNCIVFSVTDQTNDSNFTRITHTFNTGDAGTYGLFLGYYSAGEYIVFGAQLEQGSYATSYIPTSGSSVTRVADACSQTVPDGVIGQTEGTVFLDSKMALQSINNYQLFSINNVSGSDRIRILTATANRLRFIYQLGGGSLAYSFYDPTDYGSLTSLKIAFTYKSGDIKVYINGVLVNSSSNTFTIAETLTNIDIATSAGGYSQMFFNDVKLYNTALTDNELQQLTQV